MYRVETVGAFPKPFERYDLIGAGEYLSKGKIADDGRFNDFGLAIYESIRKVGFTGYSEPYQSKLWASNLLRFDPNTDRVRIKKEGFLEVYRHENENVLCIIDPTNTRSVTSLNEERTGLVPVRADGIVLPPPELNDRYRSPNSHRFIKAEELLQMIADAKKGKTLTKIDWLHTGLALPKVALPEGKLVYHISLNGWKWQYSDCVVIDPETRKLVDREMIYPFAE
jgi:hypothetical protein